MLFRSGRAGGSTVWLVPVLDLNTLILPVFLYREGWLSWLVRLSVLAATWCYGRFYPQYDHIGDDIISAWW